MAPRKSHAPTHDRHCCDRGGSAFLPVDDAPGRARPCAGADRRSARRCRSTSFIPTGRRPKGSVQRLPGGRAAAGAAVQPVPGRFGDLHPEPHRHPVAPEPDMVALLKAALQFSDLTDGAFDPTVQPLWQLYAEHFSSERPDPEGPRQREAGGSAGESGSQRPACERRARGAPQAWRRHHAERHRPGIRHRPRRGYVARRAGCRRRSSTWARYARSGREPTGRRGASGLPIRTARRAHRNRRPRRSRGRDHGGRRLPLRSGGPVHASVRSRDGTQSRAAIARSASSRRPPPRRMRFRRPSA